jgi:glutamyl-tRNA reductase
VVSTCNRTEIYTTSPNYLLVAEEYCKTIGVNLMDFLQFANILTKEEALITFSELQPDWKARLSEILRSSDRLKKHTTVSKRKTNSNPYLERAINSAIQISKRIKNETGISNGAASVSYAAVHYILNSQKRITEKNILLLGVGEIGQNTVENLVKHVYQPKIKIANRTQETAAKISEKYNIPHIDYADFDKELGNTDILIVATGARHPIVNKSHFPNGKETLVIDFPFRITLIKM